MVSVSFVCDTLHINSSGFPITKASHLFNPGSILARGVIGMGSHGLELLLFGSRVSNWMVTLLVKVKWLPRGVLMTSISGGIFASLNAFTIAPALSKFP